MGGSQLTQLKKDLRSAGLSRVSQPKDSKKRGELKKQQSVLAQARKVDRLNDIRDKYNQFDVRKEKPKFEVVSRFDKKNNISGTPTQSRTAGQELRKRTLLPLLEKRAHNSSFVDRRFGETAAHLTPEERALERFAAERQYRLNDVNDLLGDSGDADEFSLTHGGRPLSVNESSSMGDNGWGGLGENDVVRTRESNGQDEEPPKRSHAEIMKEVMAKAKMYKQERQRIKNEDTETRRELDEEFRDMRDLLGARGPQHSHQSKLVQTNKDGDDYDDEDEDASNDESESNERDESQDSDDSEKENDDDEDDEKVDGKQSSSIKEDELQLNQGDLEELLSKFGNSVGDVRQAAPESQRNLYLAGHQDSGWAKGSLDGIITGARAGIDRDIDDAEKAEMDDYDRDVKLLSLDRRARPSERLKTAAEIAKERAEALAKEERNRLRRQRGEVPTDDESEGDDDNADVASALHKARIAQADDLDDDFVTSDNEGANHRFGRGLGESDASDSDLDISDHDTDISDTDQPKKHRSSGKAPVYPCPQTGEEISKLAEEQGLSLEQIPELLQKIRVLYHPSLSEGNRELLEAFSGAVLDFVAAVASSDEYKKDAVFHNVNIFLPVLLTLARTYPIAMARHSIKRVKAHQEHLTSSLDSPKYNIYENPEVLVVPRILGFMWSTSDLWHPVAAPTMLLLTQYLSQYHVDSLQKLAAGLFQCSTALQYEQMSHRYIPEVFDYVQMALTIIFPAPSATSTLKSHLPGTFPTHLASIMELRQGLSSKFKPSNDFSERISFSGLVYPKRDTSKYASSSETRGNFAVLLLKLVNIIQEQYSDKPAFPEVLKEFLNILKLADLKAMSPSLAEHTKSTIESLEKRYKFATEGRRALLLQMHKQQAIPSYIPKFEETISSRRAFDPDSSRVQEKKLKNLVKREKKAAVREIRRDSEFIAQEERKRALEKDAQYNSKMNKLVGAISGERSEEKQYERAKKRLRRH